MSTSAREARLNAARRSPELANLHDESGWLALYAADAIVEDPVGSPPCRRGVFTLPGKKDDLERFYATFIAPTKIRVEECGDYVIGDTVVRDVVLHVQLTGGARAGIPAVLLYDLVDQGGALKVRRMRAHWDASANGREVMSQGFAGVATSVLAGVRLFRNFGQRWAKSYLDGTKRGIRKEGAPKAAALAEAIVARDAAALDAVADGAATVELPGRPAAALRSLELGALSFERCIASGYVVSARCRAQHEGRSVSGMAFVDFDPTSRKVASLRLFWEPA